MITIGSVDIGGTKIAVGAIREDGTILHRLECPTEPEKGFHHAMQRVITMLRDISAGAPPLAGIGVGCPGPLNPFTGVIGEVGTLPGWQDGNLVAELESEFHLPVAVENDADAAALGEARWGTDAACGSFIYVTISTGIGGGILLAAISIGASMAPIRKLATRSSIAPVRVAIVERAAAGRYSPAVPQWSHGFSNEIRKHSSPLPPRSVTRQDASIRLRYAAWNERDSTSDLG